MTKLLIVILFAGLTRIRGCFHEIPVWDDENTTATGSSHHLFETDDLYKLAMDVPGVDGKDLDVAVNYEERQLDLKGSSKDPDDFLVDYRQSWYIDSSVNLYDLTMAFNNGVVEVTIPKPKKKPKIRGAQGGPAIVVPNPTHSDKVETFTEHPPPQPIHAPRLGEMSPFDEEFEYWHHKL